MGNPMTETIDYKVCPQCAKRFTKQDLPATNNFKRQKYCCQGCAFDFQRSLGERRFMEKVDKGPHPKGCWLYTGFKKWDGYGWLARSDGGAKYRYVTAHRYAWILTHGQPPEGMSIMHNCDVPACCNPEHLRLGTHAENMADMKAKGRAWRGGNRKTNRPTPLHPERERPARRQP